MRAHDAGAGRNAVFAVDLQADNLAVDDVLPPIGALEIEAFEELLIAEGSDWFWWYDDNFDSALLNGALVEAIRFMKGEADLVKMYQEERKMLARACKMALDAGIDEEHYFAHDSELDQRCSPARRWRISEGEQIEIRHHSTSRQSYAQGALSAAQFLQTQSVGLFDMQDVLGLKTLKI